MRVLVIDDSAVTRNMIKNIILEEVENATFEEAADGDEALDKINDCNFDVYTIDYNMPGANGEIVALAAKTSCPNGRILMLTSQDEPQVQQRVERMGVRFLRKNGFEEELKAFISQ